MPIELSKMRCLRLVRACGAVVATLTVTLTLEPFTFTGMEVTVEDPFTKLHVTSLARGSGEQVRVTVPVKLPFGATVTVVVPELPGLATVIPPAGVTLNGPDTVITLGTGVVADK